MITIFATSQRESSGQTAAIIGIMKSDGNVFTKTVIANCSGTNDSRLNKSCHGRHFNWWSISYYYTEQFNLIIVSINPVCHGRYFNVVDFTESCNLIAYRLWPTQPRQQEQSCRLN